MPSILVVEDESGQRKVLQRILEREGYDVTLAENGLNALEKIEGTMFDLVISDMRMPGMTGRDLLREIKETDPDLPVLIVTAFAELKDAVDLVAREGAFYYLQKPINNDVLKAQIKRALEERGVFSDGEPKDVNQPVQMVHFERIIGQSERMNQLFKTMSRIIHRGVNQVLITGETGTGKDLVARAIHEKGKRKDQPFVAVNCSSVPHELIESELFGHEKGSFTGADRQKKGLFEVASGGVIFLDEIGDISMSAQSKFLRVLQDREIMRVGGIEPIKVDVCVIAATNQDLQAAVEAGAFREDLYFRLNVIQLQMPPLRERKSDIQILVDFFLQKFSEEYPDAMPKRMTPRSMSALRRYEWPGNVRQLENCLLRTFVLREGDVIDIEDLPLEISDSSLPPSNVLVEIQEEGVSLEEIVMEYIRTALRQSRGNQTKAAELLGISRRQLQNRMQNYGLNSQDFKNKHTA
ncbi:MAG: sigma-54 dependent transcriptional regulator [Candidatus Poribacteria bacterium]|nr:sigma-54 dependent transcriptional regulator [Candidatus Poribacteria bacterium]